MTLTEKLDLKEIMNGSINSMIDCLDFLDKGDIESCIKLWQTAIDNAKNAKILMITKGKHNETL